MDYTFYDLLKLLGSLGLFLYGMKIMSEGLQKAAGDRLRSILTIMTTSRVTGVLTGMLITALIQSSSATTVMVVSFVNAGLLTLTQSIGVIMGANIGTTVTAWIISAFGFKVDIASFALPLLCIALPLIFSNHSFRKSIGEFLFGFSFLFMGLAALKENAPDLSKNPEMLEFVRNYTDMGFLSIIIFLIIGTILTMIVQASAATMAITLIMCANGWISFELGAALVLGENIGTTITANLAALTANTQARRAALAHLSFNVFGVFWVLCIFHFFTSTISNFIESFMPDTNSAALISFKLSAFHSAFNICNVLIMIWFVKVIEKVVCKILPQRETDEEFRLRFITGGLLSTAELSIMQAQKEMECYGERTQRMFNLVKELLDENNEEKIIKLYSRIEKYEKISDNVEIEIANYLNRVSEGHLSSESKTTIRAMLAAVTEIESIDDSCYNLARTIRHYKDSREELNEDLIHNIKNMFSEIDASIAQMRVILGKPERIIPPDINRSNNIEDEINNLRSKYRKQNVIDVNGQKYTYQAGIYYMDLISECEKLGDYIINVVEALGGVKHT